MYFLIFPQININLGQLVLACTNLAEFKRVTKSCSCFTTSYSFPKYFCWPPSNSDRAD